MKIAVTGHLGTVGVPLVRALTAAGHEVTGIDSRHSATGVRADVADYRQLERAVPKDTELLYHLAAEFGRHNGEDYYEHVWRTNATGTKNVLTLQRDRGFKLAFASSSEVYGERDGLLSEDLTLSPLYLTNDYAISKLVNEAQIANAAKQWGNKVMTLRFFNAYGPGEYYTDYRSVVCLFVYRALMGLPITVYKDYYRAFQYIDDMVETLARIPERFIPGATVNIAGHEYTSVEYLLDVIRDQVYIPKNSITVLPQEQHNVRSKHPDTRLATALLGHNPQIRIEEGVSRTLSWMSRVYA